MTWFSLASRSLRLSWTRHKRATFNLPPRSFYKRKGADPSQPEFRQLVDMQAQEWLESHYRYRVAMRDSIHDKLMRFGGLSVRLQEIIHSIVVYGNAAFRMFWLPKQRAMVAKNISLSNVRIPNCESVLDTPLIYEIIQDEPQRINEMFAYVVDEDGNPDSQYTRAGEVREKGLCIGAVSPHYQLVRPCAGRI